MVNSVEKHVSIVIDTVFRGGGDAQKAINKLVYANERIQIAAKKGIKANKEDAAAINILNKSFNQMEKISNAVNIPMNRLGVMMERNNITFDKQGEAIDSVTKKKIKDNEVTARLWKNTQRFRMELLSVMFFGMAVERTFMGMLQPAIQAVGVFDIWNTTLEIFFLPTALSVLDIMLGLQSALLGLPEPVQAAIGAFAVLGAGVGTAMSGFGSMYLGIQGIGMLFPGLATAVSAAGGGITGVFSVLGASIGPLLANPIVLAIVAIIAIVAAAYVAWKYNIFGFRDTVKEIWEWLKPVFDTFMIYLKGVGKVWGLIWDVMATAFTVAWNIIRLPFEILFGFIKGLLEELFPGLKGRWKDTWEFIADILKSVWAVIKPIFEAIKEGLKWIRDASSAIGGFGESAGKAVGSFFRGGTVAQDFVMRPGQAPLAFSPNDTIIGTKGGMAGNTSVNVYISNDNSVSSSVDVDEMSRRIGEQVVSQVNASIRR